MTTAVAPSSPLTAVDRCDRCGAQAYLRVELQSGGELLFCAHHAREHGDKLREIAAAVQDETHKLAATPTKAADAVRCDRWLPTTLATLLSAVLVAVGLVGIVVPILPGSVLVVACILVSTTAE